ncbi:hypothetical protein MTO96_010327 [Rhipicephalus appendiculatus]
MDESVFDDRDKFKEKVAYYANVIKGNKDELLHMLESMGHVLTHRDYERRAAAVSLISDVVQILPQRFLQRQETATLLQFFVRKLDDHPVMVPPVLHGIYELIINDHEMGDTEIEKILQAILYDVPMPGLLQAERYIVYRMLAYMLLNYNSALSKIGSRFVQGCIQAIEGERDPRCLMQVFAIIPMICKNFILGELEESVFEVCACYFPVDFNPPASDAGRISREDLAEALLLCMTASAGFGKYCIPLAVEKLDSDLAVAKLDSLKLLIHGADVFPTACFKEKAVLIWRQIHNLVFVNRHEAIIPTALDCLSSLSRVLSNHKNALRALFKTIWTDLQQGEIPGMGRVLEAFASTSAEACSIALVEALPNILQLLSKNEGHRPVLVLESTTTVLSFYAALCNHQTAPQELNRLLGLLADLLCTLLTGIDDELALRAVAALRTALQIESFFTEAQLNIIKDLLVHVATHEDAPAPRDEHVLLLATAASTASLPDTVWCSLREEIDKGLNTGKLERILKMTTACAGSTLSLSKLLPYLEDCFLSFIQDVEIYYRNHLAKCLKGIADLAEMYGVSFDHTSLLENTMIAWMDTVKSGHKNESSESFADVSDLLETLSEKCSSSDMQNIIAYVEEACIDTSLADTSLLLLRCIVCHARPEALWGYPDLIPCTMLLKELLKDEKLGRPVAESFKQILQPSVLTTEGHCTIKLMHPQRFFVETVDFLIEGFNSATSEAVKENFLMGLSCQIAYVPKPVVNTYIDQILPILATALSSAEESVIEECVLPCLTENVGLMASCLDSVLAQLLRLAKPPFSMEVRRSALECLLRLSSIEEDKLLPYRQQVVQGLTQCLADRKRIVRQVAARAASMWHMVGEPKGVRNQM